MNREQAYMRMLGATANMQWNIAKMLEAKAEEAEKARNWICNHISAASFLGDQTQIKQTAQINEQVIEVLDGVNKMSQGILSVMKSVLPRNDGGGDNDGDDDEMLYGMGDMN
ncbi:restriction endonuclease subunit S [Paenibacillus glycanilyticus]|uniref:restriction endonuclease subunit S n=1 Tax=Paenibacillus glycanilyticus TaxID=126569 RepID=UPI00203ADCB6|nr:restriction endonuclease subunit S [Paenibacillus glycanilyticus]MCM3629008.1 restriction endonuclease subunit S [Paenibacillus glycanilyticus]